MSEEGGVATRAGAFLVALLLASSLTPARAAERPIVAASPSFRYPLPSWWNGKQCDTDRYSGSHPLGASFMRVAACGPRPLHDPPNDDVATVVFPGGQPVLEWECVELAMRWMYLAYGVRAYEANGYQVVENYDPDEDGGDLVRVANSGAAGNVPSPGDVMAYSQQYGLNGHTAIVTADHVDSNGNGSVTVLEENASAAGAENVPVHDWKVGEFVTGWLHSPYFLLPRAVWRPLGDTSIAAQPDGLFSAEFDGTHWGGIRVPWPLGCDYRLQGWARIVRGTGYGFVARARFVGDVPHGHGIQYAAGGYRDVQYPKGSETGRVVPHSTDTGWHGVAIQVVGSTYRSWVDGRRIFHGSTRAACGGLYIRVWRAEAEFRGLRVYPLA